MIYCFTFSYFSVKQYTNIPKFKAPIYFVHEFLDKKLRKGLAGQFVSDPGNGIWGS